MSSSVHPARSGLRGQTREEQIFYEEFVTVVGDSDVQQAVKDQISNEYSANPSGFANRLLENTAAASAGSLAASRRSPLRKFTRMLVQSLLWLGIVFLIIIPISYVVALFRGQITPTGTVLAVICILILVFVVRVMLSGRPSRLSILRLNNVQNTEAQYRDTVRTQLTEYLNILANRLHGEYIARDEEARRLAAEESAEVVLATTDAPMLVELDSQDPVRVRALLDLQSFIMSHVTSAIGISGPRGIGKTTIMRLLCSRGQGHYVGVYVPAPVRYSPADFVATIHQRTAEEILDAHGAPRRESSLLARPSAVLTVRLVVAVGLLACIAAGLFAKLEFKSLQEMSWPLAAAWGLAVIAAALLIIASIYASTNRVQRLRDKNPVALARAELERLAWSAKTQTSSKNSSHSRRYRSKTAA